MAKKEVKDVLFFPEPEIKPSYNKKKPHILCHSTEVTVIFKDSSLLQFRIPEGFLFNGANVVHKDKLLYAALVHDWLCENHNDCHYDRYISTLVFIKVAEKAGCCAFVRWWLKHSVDNWQKVFGEWEKIYGEGT